MIHPVLKYSLTQLTSPKVRSCFPQGECLKGLHGGAAPKDTHTSTSVRRREERTHGLVSLETVLRESRWGTLWPGILGRVSGAPTSVFPLEFSPPIFQFPIRSWQCLGQFSDGLGKKKQLPDYLGRAHFEVFCSLKQGRV